jgi:hypothetical protein
MVGNSRPWLGTGTKMWYELTSMYSDKARHRSQEICPPISQMVLKNFIKISLFIEECSEEILIKLAIVLKISS